MTDIQLLYVTELLSQFGDQVAKTERVMTDFRIHLSGDRWIRIAANGSKYWYLNGQLHRTDGPAMEYVNRGRFWCLNNRVHRTDGPAVERVNGDREWFLNGQLHRTDGPAIESANGDKEWFLNGQRHRTDGPAIECTAPSWWLNGVKQRKPRKLSS
jgi:hypothetical protein